MRRSKTFLAAAGALLTISCTAAQGIAASGPSTIATTTTATSAVDPDAPLALVVTGQGLAGVPVGASTPRWTVSGAVAAPDGSAVFAARPATGGAGIEIVRIAPADGSSTVIGRQRAVPPATRVAAVAPGGALLALAATDAGATVVADFDTRTGTSRWIRTFEGRLEPEAFSVDGERVFAARIYEHRYHVHVLDLAAGEQYPTLGPDKTQPPEDMVGYAVQSVLSPDRTELATLYRDEQTPGRPAFVHLLSLQTGTTVCIDMAAPFGAGERGADAIEWRSDGTVVVGHRSADPGGSMIATFRPAEIWSAPPQRHHHPDVRSDADPPVLPEGVAATAGYDRFVALVR